MPGLDPGIHLLRKKDSLRSEWIAGSSPAMTVEIAAAFADQFRHGDLTLSWA